MSQRIFNLNNIIRCTFHLILLAKECCELFNLLNFSTMKAKTQKHWITRKKCVANFCAITFVDNFNCWAKKDDFVTLCFAKTGKSPLCPAWPNYPSFSYRDLKTQCLSSVVSLSFQKLLCLAQGLSHLRAMLRVFLGLLSVAVLTFSSTVTALLHLRFLQVMIEVMKESSDSVWLKSLC